MQGVDMPADTVDGGFGMMPVYQCLDAFQPPYRDIDHHQDLSVSHGTPELGQVALFLRGA